MNMIEEAEEKKISSPQSEDCHAPVPWAHIKSLYDLIASYDVMHPKNATQKLPAQILPWLFLCDQKNVEDFPKLKKLGVSHVLSLNPVTPQKVRWMRSNYDDIGIIQKRIDAEDEEGYEMIEKHWDECLNFLQGVKGTGGKVVVHCSAGINRSGLIVCAAHMILERECVFDVVRNCVTSRGSMLWNRSFKKQLCILAAKEGLLGDYPEGYTDEPIHENLAPPPNPNIALGRLTEDDDDEEPEGLIVIAIGFAKNIVAKSYIGRLLRFQQQSQEAGYE